MIICPDNAEKTPICLIDYISIWIILILIIHIKAYKLLIIALLIIILLRYNQKL